MVGSTYIKKQGSWKRFTSNINAWDFVIDRTKLPVGFRVELDEKDIKWIEKNYTNYIKSIHWLNAFDLKWIDED